MKLAILTKPVKGKWTMWKKHQVVWVRRPVIGRNYVIERLRWKVPKLPLFNVCTNVPRKSFRFL